MATKEKIKALVNETLKRFKEEGLTVEEAKLTAYKIRNMVDTCSNASPFRIQDTEVSSTMTDLNSSENF